MTFDLRVDPPEKRSYGLPMCDDKKSSQNIHKDDILMLRVPGSLDLITWIGQQIPSEGEKILTQGSRKI